MYGKINYSFKTQTGGGGHSQARFHTGGSFNYTRHIVVIALLTLPMVIVFCEVFLWILILISGLKI